MIRAGIIAAVITYLLAVAQTMLGGRVARWGVSPDVLLVWTVCVGLQAGPRVGAVVGFASGVLQGSLTQALLGAHGCSKTISGALAGLLGGKLARENWLTPVVGVAVLTVVNELAVLLFGRMGPPPHFLRLIGLRVLYHALLAVPVYALVSRVWRTRAGAPAAAERYP